MNSPEPSLDAVLRKLRPRLLRYLAYHHAALRERHEDLIQAALADTLEYVRAKHSANADEDELARLAFTILKRRVADAFREDAARWSSEGGVDPDDLPARHADEASLDYKRALRNVVAIIATLDRRERDVLLRAAEARRAGRPMSDAQRKALSRARAELKAKLWSRHRLDVGRLLGEP